MIFILTFTIHQAKEEKIIKEYVLGLTENLSEQVLTDLREIDVEVFGASQALPHIVYARTNKTREELLEFWLIDRVSINQQIIDF